MSLQHFANFLAVFVAEPSRRQALRAQLDAARTYASVWEPAGSDWVIGASDLPRSQTMPVTARSHDVVFAEGRDDIVLRDVRRAKLLHWLEAPDDQLAALPGDFTLVHCKRGGHATAIRSCAGLVPLYLYRNQQDVWITTDLGALVTHAKRVTIDAMGLAAWAHFSALEPTRTILEHCEQIPAGHYALVSPRGFRLTRYWNPAPSRLPSFSPDAQKAHAEELRETLVSTLRRSLDPSGGNLLMLSGGVDSASVAALCKASDLPFSTLTFLPRDHAIRERELKYIDHILSATRPANRHVYSLDLEEALRVRQMAPPVVSPVFHPGLCALREISDRDSPSVLLCGSFADHIVGSVDTMQTWIDSAPAAELLQLLQARGRARNVISTRLRKLVGLPRIPGDGWLPSYISAEIREKHLSVARASRLALGKDPRPHRLLARHIQLASEALPIHWAVTSTLGVRRVLPFFSRETIELAFRCHPRELLDQGPKTLLRLALRGLVPPLNLNRADKGLWTLSHGDRRRWAVPLPPELSGIIAPTDWPLPQQPLNDADVLRLTELVNIVEAVRIRSPGR